MSTEISTDVLSPEEVTKLLQGAGFLESEQPSFGYQRVKLNGTTFEIGDEVYVSNPKTKKPAFIANIVETPKQYQARYFDPNKDGDMQLLETMGREHLAGTFCKSYFDEPQQAREKNTEGDSCKACLVNPYVPKAKVPEAAGGKKCQWRGELLLRILDEEHKVIDDNIVMVDLSTTAMMEWQGLSSDPVKGYVSDLNFMQKLAALGQKKYGGQAGIFKALTALKLGGVIAEVRALQTSSNGMNFSVISLTPIDIVDDLTEERPAIEGSSDSDDTDVPF